MLVSIKRYKKWTVFYGTITFVRPVTILRGHKHALLCPGISDFVSNHVRLLLGRSLQSRSAGRKNRKNSRTHPEPPPIPPRHHRQNFLNPSPTPEFPLSCLLSISLPHPSCPARFHTSSPHLPGSYILRPRSGLMDRSSGLWTSGQHPPSASAPQRRQPTGRGRQTLEHRNLS